MISDLSTKANPPKGGSDIPSCSPIGVPQRRQRYWACPQLEVPVSELFRLSTSAARGVQNGAPLKGMKKVIICTAAALIMGALRSSAGEATSPDGLFSVQSSRSAVSLVDSKGLPVVILRRSTTPGTTIDVSWAGHQTGNRHYQ